MARLLADAKVPWVLMHWRSVGAARPHEVPPYADVVAEVRAELLAGVDAAVSAGVDPAKLIIDPAWASPRPASTIGRCCMRCPSSSAPESRCWSERHASASWAPCWPAPTANPATAGRETATAVISAPRPCTERGACGCTMCASVDALKVVEAWTADG